MCQALSLSGRLQSVFLLKPSTVGIFMPKPVPGPSWEGLPLPARPAVTWPDDGFQQCDPSGQELQLSLLL